MHRPHRNKFYKIGLCLRGRALLRLNLVTYELGPALPVLLAPATTMQWEARSANCEALSLFFTREFAVAGSGYWPEEFAQFAPTTPPILTQSAAAASSLATLLDTIRQRCVASHPHRELVLRHLLHARLYEVAPHYMAAQRAASITRHSQAPRLVGAF